MLVQPESPALADRPRPILEARNLVKDFRLGGGLRKRQLRALAGVSLSLYPGKIVALVGESGSGKSTVARTLARLCEPSSGEILYKGKNLSGTPHTRFGPALSLLKQATAKHQTADEWLSSGGVYSMPTLAYRRLVQMIFQDPFASLNPVHTIGHHLARPLLRHGLVETPRRAKARVLELLAQVGLAPGSEFVTKHPHELSGGQRQRVAIARALAVEPAIILADEPTSMLDVSIRIDVLNLLRRLKTEAQLAYLFITHDLASARYLADEIHVMYAGHIVESAPSETLIKSAAHPYTQVLLSSVPNPEGRALGAQAASKPERMNGAMQPKAHPLDVVAAPQGCPFAARCASADERCLTKQPAPAILAPGHVVRCHMYTA